MYEWYKINKHHVFKKEQTLFYHKNLTLPLFTSCFNLPSISIFSYASEDRFYFLSITAQLPSVTPSVS